ncbi:MAG: 2-oxoacid:acceptor oxidoreductase subunit alpha [Gammaproteobacteria bacterium]|jgi:2-oxoglutarate ferredoxin oxidoreductase subunit alpha|nr:2-oxoacid:acceptor oxidoreductase subunit alpha [Gammaproteobacteria bacterium]
MAQHKHPSDRISYVVRFAGDSGDGIQLQGQQFTIASALGGNDLATLPDFPAEIRAPAGTRYGVSAFQIQFGGERITTPGDSPDVLIAFNPAALVVNLPHLAPGALIVVDEQAFTDQRLKRADLASNPLEDGTLADYEVVPVAISHLTQEAVKPFGLGTKDSLRCKNFWALGLMLWMFDQPREPSIAWIESKFGADEQIRDANLAALNAGHAYGETAELSHVLTQHPTPAAPLASAEYRTLTGAEGVALGLVAAGELADTELLFCSYPITPASSLLHHLANLEEAGVATFQAEDEIAAVCAAIGGSYAGRLGVTSSSGPGVALKTEAIGLAVATELPLIIVNSQRAGPSTGMPTKTEQSDLYQAVYGRNADTPVPVVAARSPGDCFETAIEAVRIALRHMTPVFLLTDGYIANASELWPIPDIDDFEPIGNARPGTGLPADVQGSVFRRDPATQARVWAAPGDARFVHRIGGIEKDIDTGNISYDPANHQAMTHMRADKLAKVADFIPEQTLEQGTPGGLVVVGWGSTYGTLHKAVSDSIKAGLSVAQIHLRHLNPLPKNLGDLLAQFDQILVPELNNGQLATVLRDKLGVTVQQFNQVSGLPFAVADVKQAIRDHAEVRMREVRP